MANQKLTERVADLVETEEFHKQLKTDFVELKDKLMELYEK